jgi:hypothetical protein
MAAAYISSKEPESLESSSSSGFFKLDRYYDADSHISSRNFPVIFDGDLGTGYVDSVRWSATK